MLDALLDVLLDAFVGMGAGFEPRLRLTEYSDRTLEHPVEILEREHLDQCAAKDAGGYEIARPVGSRDVGQREHLSRPGRGARRWPRRCRATCRRQWRPGAHGTSSSLPVVLRLSMSAWAFAASASGYSPPIRILSLPSAIQSNSCAVRARSRSGVWMWSRKVA